MYSLLFAVSIALSFTPSPADRRVRSKEDSGEGARVLKSGAGVGGGRWEVGGGETWLPEIAVVEGASILTSQHA